MDDEATFCFKQYTEGIKRSYLKRTRLQMLARSKNKYMNGQNIAISQNIDENKDILIEKKKTNKGRPRLTIKDCPHVNAQHYAKGMCKDCYSQNGRQKKSTACPHTDKVAFARGLCHKCYCTWYNDNAREKRRVNRQAKRQNERLQK